ncbi:MAG: 50S ribosomal protein L17 [Ignavibacteriales bacterium]|nr:50S ribosomal protein L17 [Ignavibacteriales bacterium]
MRHNTKGKKLSRKRGHRLATLRSLATSLIKHKKIKTTLTKAKEMRRFVEPLITKAKNNDIPARRLIAKFIYDKNVTKMLFDEVIEKVGDRPGGYTRIIKLGQRPGDAAQMAYIELVDFSDVLTAKLKAKTEKEEKSKKEKKSKESKSKTEAKEIEEADVEEVDSEKDTKAKPKKKVKTTPKKKVKTTDVKEKTKKKTTKTDDKKSDKKPVKKDTEKDTDKKAKSKKK